MKWTIFLVAVAASFAQSPNKCADLARFQMPGATIEITRAEMVAAGQAPGGRGGPGPMLPAHCRVNGIVDKRTGPDGKTYGIRFAVALPNNWTGDFLQQGGGLNGSVGEPIGNQAVGDKPALARGSLLPPATPDIKAPEVDSTAPSCRINRPHWISSSLRSGV